MSITQKEKPHAQRLQSIPVGYRSSDKNILCFETTQYSWIRTMFQDSILPSFSPRQNYVHVDTGDIPAKQQYKTKLSLCTPWRHTGEAQLQLHWSVTSAENTAEWPASCISCFNAGKGSTTSTEQEARCAAGLVWCSGKKEYLLLLLRNKLHTVQPLDYH